MTPPVATLPVGASVPLVLTGKLADGTSKQANSAATWESSDSATASVSALGVVVALAAGQTTITAKLGTLTAAAQITVSAKTVKSLAISPQSGSLSIGATLAFSAIATMDDGSKETVSAAVAWTSDDHAVATINSTGLATAIAAGTATIRGKLGGIEATAKLNVTTAKLTELSLSPVDPTLSIGASVAFSAEASYDDGSVASVSKAATWTSSAPNVASVAGDGVATAKAAGTAIIKAEYGGVSASRVLTVQASKLSSFVLSPAHVQVTVGGTVDFQALGIYANGEQANLTQSAVWTTAPAGFAVVSNAPGSQGRATGIKAGNTEVSASFGGLTAQSLLMVVNPKLTAVAIGGGGSSPKGVQKQLTAQGTYSDGQTLDITNKVTWESSHQNVATVDNATKKGWLIAVGEGKSTITATLDNIFGNTDITVTAAALLKITVDPANKDVPAGLKQAFTAKAQYSDGVVVDVTKTAVWSTSDSSIAAISNAEGANGLLSALKAGKIKVTATLDKVAGSADVTISQPQLTELTIGPQNLSRKAGQYVQYWAIAVYSNGQTQNVTQQASWTVSDATVASIQTSGNFKGVAQGKKAGKVTITVAHAGKTASTQLTISDPELVSIQISPAAWEMPVGLPMQFQAIAQFSDDSTQNVTFQSTWSTSDQKVALVGNAGGGPGGGGPGGGLNKGRIQATGPGKASIKAEYKGFSGAAALTVTPAQQTGLQIFPGHQEMPAGQFRKFEASLLWSDGSSTPVTNFVSWTSSDTSVAAALNGQNQRGLVQGLKPGTATITASGQGWKATATIKVTTAEAKALLITPGTATVAKGVPVVFHATALFSDDTTQQLGGNQVSFTSSDPTVAAVFSSGQQAGTTQTLKAGTATITATWSSLKATAQLTVKSAEIKEIQVTPTTPKIAPLTWLPMQAVAVFTDQTTQQITPIASWKTSDASVAAISNLGQPPGKGILQALKAGTATVTATWTGVSGSTVVTVQSAALKEIQITPFVPTLPLGIIAQFRATGIFADNTTQDLTAQVSWVSTDSTVASVSAANPSKGRVTPLKAGKTTITAKFGEIVGKAELSVTAAKLLSLAVAPADSTLDLFANGQLQAVGSYADGAKVNLTWWVLWASDKPAIAPVSNAADSKGRVTGIGVGVATITASKDGIDGKAKVTVK